MRGWIADTRRSRFSNATSRGKFFDTATPIMGTFGTRQRRFFQTSLLGLIFLVGVSAAAIWSWRRYTSSNRAETVADLVHLIGSGGLEERRLAARRLVMAATSQLELVIPALLLSLEDPSADVRERRGRITGCLSRLGPIESRSSLAEFRAGTSQTSIAWVRSCSIPSRRTMTPDVRVSAASALALIRSKLDAVSGPETMPSRPTSLAHGTLVAAFDAALAA